MSIDHELLEAGVEVIRELSQAKNMKLPVSSHRMIAVQMLKHDKLGDEAWCEQKLISEERRFNDRLNRSKHKGFYPFVNVGIGACRWIRKNYGAWTLELMKNKLENPFDAYTNWAIRFAATMKAVGFEECERADDLHSLIVSHPSWKEMVKETKAWVEYVKKIKAKNSKKDMIH